MTLSNDLQDDLRKLRTSSAQRFQKLAGIDTSALDRIAGEVDPQYEALATKVRKELAGDAKRIVQEHDAWLKFNKRYLQQRFTRLVAQPLPPQPCFCWPIFEEDSAEVQSSTECFGSCFENNPNLGPEPNTAHPLLVVHGPGSNNENVAETRLRFDFELEPAADGEYCILPSCQVSGTWLAWTWGSCGSNAASSRAHVSVEKTVQVFQPFDDFEYALALSVGGPPVYSVSHQIVDHVAQGGGTDQSGFAFNGVPAFGVDLRGGDPVTVRITCVIRASVEGFGRAIIDLNTSPNFYVRVPEFRWGPPICFS